MESFAEYGWPVVVSAVHVSAAVATTIHAVLSKREVRAAIGWVGLAWLTPVLGSLAYLCLGINRIQRIGVALEIDEAWRPPSHLVPSPEETRQMGEVVARFPALVGLAELGERLAGRLLLSGNRVEALVNGDEAFPAMLAAIDRAERSVALLSYIFEPDRAGQKFFDALVGAVRRGVEVRVLVDGVGARYGGRSIVPSLRAAGVPVATFLESRRPALLRYANLRNHRKILVVDGSTGFTGGTNIREGHWLALDPAFPVACLHFRFEGPVVADLGRVFAIDWAFTTGEELVGLEWFPGPGPHGHVAARGIADGPDEDIDKMEDLLLGALAVADSSVQIVTPYFLPDEALLRALMVTAMRGVAVDIVIPARNNIRLMDWAVTPLLSHLVEKGCRVYRSPDPFDHTKLLVVDRVWSLVGSTNWDARSLRLNFEFNVECYDRNLAGQLGALVDARAAASREVTPADLRDRPLPLRLRDGVTRLFSPYL
jgi:cardiolipin synthase